MRKALVLGSLLVLLLGLSGCGASADSLMKDQIKAMNDMADAIETNASESKVAEIKKRIEENNKKLEQLKLSDEDKKKLVEKHKEELTGAATRMQKAMMNKAMKNFGQGLPGLPKIGD